MDEIPVMLNDNIDVDTELWSLPEFLKQLGFFLLLIILCFLGWRLLQNLNKKIFERLNNKKGRSLTLDFLERVISLGITLFFIIIPFNWDSLRQSIFGSAALLTAVIGFAAQDVIKDILAGLQMSFYKPFDIGDRIELDDGTAGIVENITMRHVVLKRIDTLRVVIPNSKMNDYSVINYSYDNVPRSMLLNFPVAYNSDIRKVKKVIRDVVINSPHTIPGVKGKNGEKDYPPVYFIDLNASALVMSVTVYYEGKTPSEVVKDDINTSVFEALAANGIEVPYNYVNVVLQKDQH